MYFRREHSEAGCSARGKALCSIFVSCRPLSFDLLKNNMEFQIEKNSTVPAIKQIQEQIKLSIAMGVLKRGDILPPIREVEKQTGINRGQIHRAYLALRQSGLLSPAPGKRIAVAVSAAAPDIINKKCQELSKDIIKRIRRIGVSPIAFARYLSRNVQEDERRYPFVAYVDLEKETALRRAEQVSRLWHASVIGLSLDEFKLALTHGSKLRKVLVNHLYCGQHATCVSGKESRYYSHRDLLYGTNDKGAGKNKSLSDTAAASQPCRTKRAVHC